MAQHLKKLLLGGLTFCIGAVTLSKSVYFVRSGHRAVIFDRTRGLLPDTKGKGIHMVIPFWQVPTILRVSAAPKDVHIQADSRDLQQVDVNVSLSYKPDEDKLADIYKKFGSRYADAILPTIGQHASKDVIARYNAGDLLERNEAVVNEIREEFIAKSKRFDILLDSVSITLAIRDISN